MRPLRLRSEPWSAAWPADRGGLAGALAVAAAFPSLVGSLAIELSGDVEAAFAGVIADLGVDGLTVDDLPRVELLGVETLGRAPGIGGLAAELSKSAEYERRPWLPVFAAGDTRHGRVWAAADSALAIDERARVAVLAEELDHRAVAVDCHRVAVISGNPALRRVARRRGMAAYPRPPAARHLPGADIVIADARRPEDLGLVRGFAGSIDLVNDEHLAPLARRAFGLDSQSSSDSARSVATSTTRRSAPTLCTPSSSMTVQ
jgi:hypothetical protein